MVDAGIFFGGEQCGHDGLVGVTAILGAVESVAGGGRDRRGNADFAGNLDGQGDILRGPLEVEGWIVEVTRQQRGHDADITLGRGDAHHFVRALRVESGCLRDHRGFDQDLHRGDADHVVDDLGQRTHAELAHVEHIGADALKHGLVAIEYGFVTADHDGKRRINRALDAVGDRGVEECDAVFGGAFGEHLDGRRQVGGEIKAGEPWRCALEDAVGAAQDGGDFARAWQGRQHDLGLSGDLSRRLCPNGAKLDQVGGVLLNEVVDDDPVSALDHVRAHRIADVADSDESDVRHELPPNGLHAAQRRLPSGRRYPAVVTERSSTGVLQGVQVLELSVTAAGAYCGRLLAGFGAEVTLVEPLGGSPLRRRGPARDDRPDREGGATHLHLNRGKRSLRLSLDTAAGRRLLEQQLAEADVLIVDCERHAWTQQGIDPIGWQARHPELHVCVLTPYGLSGPKASWRGTELTLYAAGGYLRIGGEPHREPVKAWGDQGHQQAGLHAALGIAASLYADAGGQQIDTAVFEALAFLLGGGYQHAWFSDAEPKRNGARLVGFGPGHLYPSTIRPCADGWVHAHCNNRYPEVMALLFDQERLADPELLGTLMGHADEVDALMSPMLMATPRREVVRRAQELRIPFTEVLAPSEVMVDADGQHGSRDFWQSVPHPRGGEYRAAGPAVRFGRTKWMDGVAPSLGQDNARLGGTRQDRVRWRRAGVA